MASPDHAAGLAVVVPPSDNRSQPRGKVKQNAFTSPRKPSSQSGTMFPPKLSNGTHPAPRYVNGMATQNPMKAVPSGQLLNGTTLQQNNGGNHLQENGTSQTQPKAPVNYTSTNGATPGPRRLLGVDEALQFSPFSSIVPFSSGINNFKSRTCKR